MDWWGNRMTGLLRLINPKLPPREALALFYRAGFSSNGSRHEQRVYKRLWARVKRLDPVFRRACAGRRRKDDQDEKTRKKHRASRTRWGKSRKGRARLAAYNAQYHRENRRRYCGVCGRPAPRGRYGLRHVVRNVEIGGQLVSRRLLWCGC